MLLKLLSGMVRQQDTFWLPLLQEYKNIIVFFAKKKLSSGATGHQLLTRAIA